MPTEVNDDRVRAWLRHVAQKLGEPVEGAAGRAAVVLVKNYGLRLASREARR